MHYERDADLAVRESPGEVSTEAARRLKDDAVAGRPRLTYSEHERMIRAEHAARMELAAMPEQSGDYGENLDALEQELRTIQATLSRPRDLATDMRRRADMRRLCGRARRGTIRPQRTYGVRRRPGVSRSVRAHAPPCDSEGESSDAEPEPLAVHLAGSQTAFMEVAA